MVFDWLKRPKSVPTPVANVPIDLHAPIIELEAVIKAYDTAAGPYVALKGIDLMINRGEFVAIVGKSGSGKSTLMNMITGIDRPTQGEVRVAGTTITHLDENALAQWRGRSIGIIFQFFQLLPTLTVAENIMLPMDFCDFGSESERRERAVALLARMEMSEHADKLPTALSGGQQQRVAIARALANDPPLLMADEPTGNLDSRTADAIFTLFQDLANQGKTVVMVTHDADLSSRAGRSVTVTDGQIVNTERNIS
jgi:putative ABC transport system ATP-binding protein